MADIVFDYEKIESSVSNINGYAGQYRNAATTFLSQFEGAISSWEGASKDKLLNLVNDNIMTYLRDNVPNAVEQFAVLLKSNAEQMQKADDDIASSIDQMIG